MSELFNSIPPEQQTAYLQNAESAVRQASEPVIEDIGRLLLSDATELVQVDAQASTIGDRAQLFLDTNNYMNNLDAAASVEGDDPVRSAELHLEGHDLAQKAFSTPLRRYEIGAMQPSTHDLMRNQPPQQPPSV